MSASISFVVVVAHISLRERKREPRPAPSLPSFFLLQAHSRSRRDEAARCKEKTEKTPFLTSWSGRAEGAALPPRPRPWMPP